MPTIIIADDSVFQRFSLKKIVDKLQFQVIEAKNGQECMDAVDTHNPDVILLDLNMPVLTGFDVLDQLRSKENPPAVIVVSADIQESTKQRCRDSGAAAILSKPFQERELLSLVTELTASRT